MGIHANLPTVARAVALDATRRDINAVLSTLPGTRDVDMLFGLLITRVGTDSKAALEALQDIYHAEQSDGDRWLDAADRLGRVATTIHRDAEAF